jgi:hypothetical protein
VSSTNDAPSKTWSDIGNHSGRASAAVGHAGFARRCPPVTAGRGKEGEGVAPRSDMLDDKVKLSMLSN